MNVTIKTIPPEAVAKSGSIRFLGISAEEFVAPDSVGTSKKDTLQEKLSNTFNVSVENVDVFTVLHSPHQNSSLLDVRFSAHGSPYYESERLNTMVELEAEGIEQAMGVSVLMVNIDECLFEKVKSYTDYSSNRFYLFPHLVHLIYLSQVYCNGSCRSVLKTYSEPYVVFTNLSSFVGVNAVIDPECICHVQEPITCLNGGTPLNNECECPEGFEGPSCESTAISFKGNGYAIMPPMGKTCDDSHLSKDFYF